MRIDIIPITALSADLKQQWQQAQASNPHLAGPCFHPELYIAVGKYCPHVYAAVLQQPGSHDTAFWPFMKDPDTSIAKQMRLCDYSAIIGSPAVPWDMNAIMKKANLRRWEFLAMPETANIKANWGASEHTEAPRVDLTDGLPAYLESQQHRKAGYKEMLYKRRLIERHLGPVRFVPICSDVKVLHRMLSWKSDRYTLSNGWTKESMGIFENIYHLRNSPFSGALSALYAGDSLLAASFCLRFKGILHGSAMAFNPEFTKFSAGALLLFSLISRLRDFQCDILDLGPGSAAYKFNFANKTVPVIRGNIRVCSLKERIKSVNWLYAGLRPLVQPARVMLQHLHLTPHH